MATVPEDRTEPKPLLGPKEMEVVERVLEMRSGYVLDFSDRTFDEFIAHEVDVDATAPRFSADGGSKAKRLRRILPSLPSQRQAKLLRAFLEYRDSPTRSTPLDDEWRTAFVAIIERLQEFGNQDPPWPGQPPTTVSASAWTGRRSLREQIAVVRGLVPMALQEVGALADLVEERRFNDQVTADAVACLRELHVQLGELIAAVDRGHLTKALVAAVEANRERLIALLREGAKATITAPAMTLGVVHLLSLLTGAPMDSTMVAGVYGSLLGADVLKSLGRRTSIGE
ncbi:MULTISPECIES: hypothetical protein [unclassified Sphingomonas]|uniref:hypothetical protein n=1 Tax=unclassified Sphingomonas TaxID=196159 RepID=UPI000926ADDB|nr:MULTISPECIES: hypothetical protein [unclassified Sphingomonas]OJU22845.1 MAG: hypothetical protein BGN95_05210 [Sphingomonas sp. 66-10]